MHLAYIATVEGTTGVRLRTVTSSPTVFEYTFTPSGDNANAGVDLLVGKTGGHYADINIYAIKLEIGSVQTLAHQDSGGNWVLNEIPDYGEELAKCQRYQVDIGGYYPVAVNNGGMSYEFLVYLPVDMRGTPNVDLSDVSIVNTNVSVNTDGTYSVADFRGRTLRIRFAPSLPPATLGTALLHVPIRTIADANR